MTTQPQTYELAPRAGMPASQRLGELNAARFVAVRNLAHLIYKKPDGSSLMTYQETLDDRERVKLTIVEHEIALGLLSNDLGATPAAVAAPVAPTQAAAVAAPQPTPAQQVPMQPTMPQMPVAAPQMAPVAPMPVAPVAAPQMVAQVAPAPGAPAEQSAPAPVTGRARRGRGTGAGVAVAPPPAAAAPMVPLAAAPTAMAAPQAMAAPMAAPTPMAAPMAAPMAPAFIPPTVGTATAQGGAPAPVDLSPVIGRLDKLGEGVSALSAENDALKAQLGLLLIAVHHLYSTDPTLSASIKGMNINQFIDVLKQYAGNPK